MKVLENVKKEHNLMFDCVSDYEIGQIYGDFEIIDIGKYVYKVHKQQYKPVLTIKCLHCNTVYFIRENDFTKSENKCLCNIPRKKKGGKGLINTSKNVHMYIGNTNYNLIIKDFVKIFDGNYKPNTKCFTKYIVCDCLKCGAINIIKKPSEFRKTQDCGCSSLELAERYRKDYKIKIGDIFGTWKAIGFHHEEIKNGKKQYFYVYKCCCEDNCGEIRIINSKLVKNTVCKCQVNKRSRYIKEMKEKLIESPAPNFAPNLIGYKTGTLEVIAFSFVINEGERQNQRYWLTKCCVCNKITCHSEGQLIREELFSDGCLNSFGEIKISNFLIKNNITFKPEKIFSDCKYENVLPFDFYIEHPKTKEWFLIEFQGTQHKDNKNWTKDKEKANTLFSKILLRDKIKFNYAKEKGIRLEYIWYEDLNNIEKILCEMLDIKFSEDKIIRKEESKELQVYYNKISKEIAKLKKQYSNSKGKKNYKKTQQDYIIKEGRLITEEINLEEEGT